MQFNYNANRISNTNEFVTTIDFPLYTCWFGEFIRIASGIKIRGEKLMNGIYVFTRGIEFNFHQYPHE